MLVPPPPLAPLQASMLTEPGGPFIDVSKLNLVRYATRPALARALFEYLFHHENDVRSVSAGSSGTGRQVWVKPAMIVRCESVNV